MSNKGIERAYKKALKKSYKHLSKTQKIIVKLHERKEEIEKYFYGHKGFYKNAPRINGYYSPIDWDLVHDADLDLFDDMTKENKKISDKLSKFTKEEIEDALVTFNQTQFSLSQSF